MKKAGMTLVWGVFYLFLVFLCEFIGFLHPWCWILYPALAAIVAAYPVFKAVQKLDGSYIFLCFGILEILFYLLDFNVFTLQAIAFTAVVALIAELLHRSLGYGTKKALLVSYPVFAIAALGNVIAIWTSSEEYVVCAIDDMGAEYGSILSELTGVWTLIIAMAATIVLALIAVNLFQAKVKRLE